MTAVVFAGPSVFPLSAPVSAAVSILPPAGKGDLLTAAECGASTIGLIDGVFENAPSVWHKEILYCIDKGITVFGSASMGALRAAECARFGMIGIGRIFQDYASGRRVSDADVAILHAPADLGYKPLSVALVDVDAVLERKRAQGALNETEFKLLSALAAKMHFKQRTWKRLFRDCGISPTKIREIFGSNVEIHFSQKRSDGYQLLNLIQTCSPEPVLTKSSSFEFQNSHFFTNLQKSMQQR